MNVPANWRARLARMPAASRKPTHLAGRMSQRLLRANAAQVESANRLITWASWHLDTAAMGWDVYRLALPNGDDNLTGHPLHTVEIAAENLIFRGVVSAMDQCAAAIFRLTSEPYRADREHDVGWWFDARGGRPWQLVPQPLAQWLRVFDGNATWKLATELRDAFTHRTIRRDINVLVSVGWKAKATAKFEVAGALHEVEDLMPLLVAFGTRRYSAFERALARAYPLR